MLREGTKKTVFVNFAELAKAMHRAPEHVITFLLAELGARLTEEWESEEGGSGGGRGEGEEGWAFSAAAWLSAAVHSGVLHTSSLPHLAPVLTRSPRVPLALAPCPPRRQAPRVTWTGSSAWW